ncbi:hypothetical protein [Hymenobacter terricola]|uniref:hypothetical protein n=1 Tax=Hymenobacter terricola TaxID=2819236 RepID=UPI001B31758B|nr:hypothetical protein [Hymenobacter terricola]
MTRPQTIATNYVGYVDQDFIDLGENILTGVAGNKDYPTPPQAIKDLTDLLALLAEAVRMMKTGLKAATQQRATSWPPATATAPCLTREPKAVIDTLDSGAAYGVECAAWNNTGPLQWSTAVFRIVQ